MLVTDWFVAAARVRKKQKNEQVQALTTVALLNFNFPQVAAMAAASTVTATTASLSHPTITHPMPILMLTPSAKKISDRAEKIATALAKEAESAIDNLMEVNVMNTIVKYSLFIKDYKNDEDYSRVKEMVRYLC